MEEKLELSFGGGALSLFGAPFFLAGLGAMIGSFVAPGSHGQSLAVGERVFFFLLSLPFTLVGSAFLLGRGGTIFSKREGTLKTWWGLIGFPFSTTIKDLSLYHEIQIISEMRGGKNKSTFYVVYLAGPNNERMEIQSNSEYNDSRALGERIAKYLDFGILDSSTGKGVFRAAGTLDQSVRDQALAKGETLNVPPMPVNCRISFTPSETEQSAFFVLPAPGFHGEMLFVIPLVLVMTILAVGFGTIPVLTTFWKEISSTSGKGLLLGLVLAADMLPLFIGITYVLSKARAIERIGVSSKGMIIEQTGLFLNSKTTLLGKEIEELFINSADFSGNPKAEGISKFFRPATIVLRGDKRSVHCGVGLTMPELEWFKEALRFYLVGAPPSP